MKISDSKEGTDEFVYNARIWMKDKMSIAAVKEGDNKLIGVLIMRIQEKSMYVHIYCLFFLSSVSSMLASDLCATLSA